MMDGMISRKGAEAQSEEIIRFDGFPLFIFASFAPLRESSADVSRR